MLLLALALLGTDPADEVPLLLGVFPPGVTVGTRQVWTMTGRHLDAVDAVLAPGAGLTFGPIAAEPGGLALRVEVAADPAAPPGFHAVRLDGPTGISNLGLVRVDALAQVVEVEPNDRGTAPDQAIPVGTAVAGTIRPLDVDHFRVEGTPGRAATLDWETRRLGTAIIPVLTITGPDGAVIAQARSSPGGDRDCRVGVVVPPEGWFAVELRDNTYAGDDRARYRLRVDPAPFGTGPWPLGGPRGSDLKGTVAGGNLAGPVEFRVTLPAVAGTWFDPGPRVDPASGRAFPPPGRLRVADLDRPEMIEPTGRTPADARPVALDRRGVTINGRLDWPDEVDRFRVELKAGDRFRAEVEAAPLGSWLDSVVTVRDARGQILGANDDPRPSPLIVPPSTIDGASSVDSVVDLVVPADGPLTVELADRFGAGGPEYGYRLDLGPPRDDFAVSLLPSPTSADPALASRAVTQPDDPGFDRAAGWSGAFNLRPGTTTAVPFVILPRGRPGSVEVRAVDLPPGVTSEAETIRLAGPPRRGSPGDRGFDAPPLVAALRLRVDAAAPPVRGAFRVMVRRRGVEASERDATAIIGVDAAGGPGRPVVWPLGSFPIRVLGPVRR